MVNRLRLQVFVAIVGLVAIGVALAYFLLVITPTNEPAPGGTYVEGVVVDTSLSLTLNPLYARANTLSHDVTALMYSGLTRSGPGRSADQPGQVIEPDLADRWTSSPDGKLWEFHLRRDARWQDGLPITSRDVVFTINLIKNEEYGTGGDRDLRNLWKDVEVSRLGDYTVRFRLEQAQPAFLNYTTLGLLPAHKLDGKIKLTDLARRDFEFNLAPVGNGPYQLAPGGLTSDGVTLIANSLYHGKKPYLDKIWFRFYPSASAALSALQSNQIDGVSEITANEVKRLDTLKNVTEISAPKSVNTFLFLNLQRSALFGQKEVRQAIAHAVNKQGLVTKALLGQAQVSESPILASSWAYKSDIKSYNFDLEKARQMLDAAGWKVGRDGVRERNGQALVFKILIEDNLEKRAVVAQLAESLRNIEIVVQLDVAPSLVELDRAIKSNNYDALVFAVQGLQNDPDQYVTWHSSYAEPGDNHRNYANWRLNRADEMLEKARSMVDQAERRKLYLQWQEIWAEEVPSIPLYYSTYNYVVSNRVRGVETQNLKVLNVASDRLKDISSRYIFFNTRFGS